MKYSIVACLMLVLYGNVFAEVDINGCRKTKDKGLQCRPQTQETYQRKYDEKLARDQKELDNMQKPAKVKKWSYSTQAQKK